MALDVSALNDFNNEVAGKVVQKIVFEGILDDEILSMRVKEGKAKIESGANYLGE